MSRLDRLFDVMLETGASDLHIVENNPPRLRLHGAITPIEGWPAVSGEQMESILQEICTEARWEKFQETGDLDFSHSYGRKARFRCNYNKQAAGYGAVFRIIPADIVPLDRLGVPPVINSFGDYVSGLVLVTGPTGSGKSTTLAGVINTINEKSARRILTIEEPIEFVHKPIKSTIVQREAGRHCKSFSDGLASATRQDFDVILVGEMRDLETISLAVTAAEMGVLVFGTLHTNNAVKTVDRIIDVFPAEQQAAIRSMLAVSLRAVSSQLLLRKKDGRGRVPVTEVMIQNRAISNYIREGKTNQIPQVIMSNRQIGMQLMDDGIESLMQQGAVSAEEAYLKSIDKDRFKRYLREAKMPGV